MIGTLQPGLLVFFLLGVASSCGTGSRNWGEIVIAPEAPILVGVGVDSSGAMGLGDGLTPKLVSMIAGHPLQIVGIPVHCQGAQPSDLVPSAIDIQSLSGFVGPACSASCIYSESVLFELRTTMLVPGCTAAEVVGQGFSNVFRIAWNDNDQARVAADFVLNDLHLRRAAVVRDSSVYSRSLSNAFVSELKSHGGSGQELEISLSGPIDVEQVQRRVRAAGAGAVFFAVSRPDAAELAARLHAALPETALIASDSVLVPGGCYASEGRLTDGDCSSLAATPGVLVAVGMARHDGQWGSELDLGSASATLFADQLSDSVDLFGSAIARTAKPRSDGSLIIDRQAVRDAIAEIRFEGHSGRIDFTAVGERKHDVGAALYQLRAGRLELVRTLKH